MPWRSLPKPIGSYLMNGSSNTVQLSSTPFPLYELCSAKILNLLYFRLGCIHGHHWTEDGLVEFTRGHQPTLGETRSHVFREVSIHFMRSFVSISLQTFFTWRESSPLLISPAPLPSYGIGNVALLFDHRTDYEVE